MGESGRIAKAADCAVRRISHGGNDGRGIDHFTRLEIHPSRGDGADTIIQAKFESSVSELPGGVVAEFGPEGVEDAVPAVNEKDADLFWRNVRIIAPCFAEEIEHLPRRLHARISSPHDDERQEASPDFAAGLGIRLLEPRDESGSQDHGVTDVLHDESVLGHPRDTTEVDLRPKGEDEMLESDHDPGREGTGVDLHLALFQVDRADPATHDTKPPAESANRIDDMARGYRGPGDLGEHGLENEVILIRYDDGVSGIPPRAFQFPGEALPTGDSGEAASEDDDFEIDAGGVR